MWKNRLIKSPNNDRGRHSSKAFFQNQVSFELGMMEQPYNASFQSAYQSEHKIDFVFWCFIFSKLHFWSVCYDYFVNFVFQTGSPDLYSSTVEHLSGKQTIIRSRSIYTPRLVIEHNTWQNKFYLFLRSLTRSYFPFLEMFNLSETVLIIDRHLTRSFTVSFQLCRIFPVFKMQLSLKRSLGRPIGREPSASSPYNNRLQVLLSSIRETLNVSRMFLDQYAA